MRQPKVLALVMAGGAGQRMAPLTDERAKPALPFAGVFRLIDFPLSNLMHSGIADVWVVEQFQPHMLNEHIAGGRPWDLDRTYGGLRIMPPYQGADESGWHQGNADAIYRNARLIRALGPDLLLVLSADHLYTLDYREAIAAHQERGAEVTLVTTRVPREQATRFGNVQADGDGKVVRFAYKPAEPLGETVTTEIFVYSAEMLLEALDRLVAAKTDAGEEAALKDFGHELLPALVERGKVFTLPLDGYWRDVGMPGAYLQAHLDLLDAEPPLDLDDPRWPILTHGVQRLPARVERTAAVAQSLIAPGCRVHGLVERAVLGPGVVIEEGADVRDAVVFENTIIRAGAKVACAILDSEVVVGPGAQVGADGAFDGDEAGEKLVVVGRGAQIAAGAKVAPGERVEVGAQRDAGERAVGAAKGDA